MTNEKLCLASKTAHTNFKVYLILFVVVFMFLQVISCFTLKFSCLDVPYFGFNSCICIFSLFCDCHYFHLLNCIHLCPVPTCLLTSFTLVYFYKPGFPFNFATFSSGFLYLFFGLLFSCWTFCIFRFLY